MCSHYGDLGNITADGKGVAKVDMTDKLVTVVGKDSVVGRTIVVSSKVVVKHPGILKTTPHIFSYPLAIILHGSHGPGILLEKLLGP